MTTAKRQRLAGLTSMLAGHRLYGKGSMLTLTVHSAEEAAETRDAITDFFGYQSDLVCGPKGDSYRWYLKGDCVTLLWMHEQSKAADIVSLEAKRQERTLDEQLRASIAKHGETPDPNFRPGA